MRLDNSAFSLYMSCPQKYYERYEAPQDDVQRPQDGPGLVQISGTAQTDPVSQLPVAVRVASGDQNGSGGQPNRGIELDESREGLNFGTRMHQLLHERRLRRLGQPVVASAEWPDEAIESEAQATLAAYEAHYVRDYAYLESERTHIIPLERPCPRCDSDKYRDHEAHNAIFDSQLTEDQRECTNCGCIYSIHGLIVKLDAVVRHDDATIGPMDTKTESRSGYNTRKDWAGRTQAKAYLYALERLYPHERVSRLVVDVVSRQSPKARRPVGFYRIDDIDGTPDAIQEAIRNMNYVADRIEEHRKTGWWPSNMNACKRGWDECDFYLLHVEGRTQANLKKYRPAEIYLEV